ncbi:acetylornithine deacetylase [Rickettsiales bacterium]|nr:acetylornithine deacetylase [Rickettsiales bacterium]
MKIEKLIAKLISYKTISESENISLLNFITEYLDSYNVSSKIINKTNNRANLYARLGPNVSGGIMFSGHTDVVPVEGQKWNSDPFKLKKSGDRLYGRGTSDMKSFIAIVLSLVPEIVKLNLKRPIDFMFSFDEEIGCVGIQKAIPFIEKIKYKPASCIVGEPTEMKVINQHKGKKNFLVIFNGIESHSSLVDKGVNTINYAAKFICFLKSIEEELKKSENLDKSFSPPYTSINVGIIDGGIALNIIPKECKVEFEIRDLPNTDSKEIITKIKKFLFSNLEKEMKKENKACSISFHVTNNFPPLKTNQTDSLINLCLRSLNSNNIGSVSFGTEAGVFDKIGIETIVCGPGSINQAHKPDEYITKNQIQKCEVFLKKIIKTLC